MSLNDVVQHVQGSSCFTLEALASSVAHTALLEAGNDTDSVTVRAAKPSALPLARAAEVEISRTLRDFQHHAKADGLEPVCSQPRATPKAGFLGIVPHPSLSSLLDGLQPRNTIPYKHTAALALGANLGDRFANIELALRLLEAPTGGGNGPPKAAVINTSFMYETAPMYVTDQPRFINCACIVRLFASSRAHISTVVPLDRDRYGTHGVVAFRQGDREHSGASDFFQERPAGHRRRHPYL